jgi:hypothetical protein
MNILARFNKWNNRRKLLAKCKRWISGYNFAFDMYFQFGATAPCKWEPFTWAEDYDEFDEGIQEAVRDYDSGKLLRIITEIESRGFK